MSSVFGFHVGPDKEWVLAVAGRGCRTDLGFRGLGFRGFGV